MLKGVSETSLITLKLIEGIRALMADYKLRMRRDLPRIYSQDILNNIFRHPYTRIEYVQEDLDVTRQTASKYLDLLVDAGFLLKRQTGRSNYFVNAPLVALFLDVSADYDRP
jgi:Fic family protein